ncbi:MAG: bifunctional helix-turn-helix transcriptional regulator/GNAT family N-acetyltransferase [Acidimicrobiales bacterium]
MPRVPAPTADSTADPDGAVDRLRRFNRAYTRRIGVLDDSFLGRGRPLGSCRVLYEAGPDGADVADIRARLGVDPAYLSRVLRGLDDEGLITLDTDSDDARRRRVTLTPAGVAEWRALEEASQVAAVDLLAPLDESRRARLADALDTAHRLLLAAAIEIELVAPDHPLAAASMGAYFDEIDERFDEGFDPGDGVDEGLRAMRRPTGGFWVAVDADRALGCVGLQAIEPTGPAAAGGRSAEIKRMWVSTEARGTGLGRRLLELVEDDARSLGYDQVVLDTNERLVEAIALYESAGYVRTERYNDNPYPTHWFAKPLA